MKRFLVVALLAVAGCAQSGTPIDVGRVLRAWSTDGEAQAFLEQDGARVWGRWDGETFVPIGAAPSDVSEDTLVLAASRDEVYSITEPERVLRVSTGGDWVTSAVLPGDDAPLRAICGRTSEGIFVLGLRFSQEIPPGSSFANSVYRMTIHRAGDTLDTIAPPVAQTGAFQHRCFVSGGALFVLVDGAVYRREGATWIDETPDGAGDPRPWEAEVVHVAGEARLWLYGALWRWEDGWRSDALPVPAELAGTNAVPSLTGMALDDLFMVNDVVTGGSGCFFDICGGGGALDHVEVRRWDGVEWSQWANLPIVEADGERLGLSASFTDSSGTYAIVGQRRLHGPF